MKPSLIRRLIGLAAGSALIAIGAAEIGMSRDSSPAVPFCQAGFCPEQFSPQRVFEIGQKAALGDARGELEDFKRAIRLSPASAYRWLDLGEAEVNVRDYAQAHYAFAQARKAGPHNPVVMVRATNADFEMGDMPGVLSNGYSILSDPDLWEYDDTVFLTYSRSDIPLDTMLTQGVPQAREPLAKLLLFWTRVHKQTEAVATWKWSRKLGLTEDASTGGFLQFLVDAGDPPLAQSLWDEYAHYPAGSRIFNPGFETAFQPSPFDWTINERKDVEAVRSPDAAHTGAWSLRIRFNGDTNTAYRQTSQLMSLPAGRYRLSAMVKSDQLTTDEGLRFHIVDATTPANLDSWSNTVTGSQDWRPVMHNFEVTGGSKLIRIELARQTSDKFDNKIGGTVWIDDVYVAKLP